MGLECYSLNRPLAMKMRRRQHILGAALLITGLLIAPDAFAGLTSNLIGFTWFIHVFLKKLCTLTGAAMLVGSLFQYRNHRMNPMNIRMSQVFTLLFLGLALMGLGYLPMFGQGQKTQKTQAYQGYSNGDAAVGGNTQSYRYVR